MGQALEDILRHPAIWRVGQLPRSDRQGIATGCARLDRELPERGWPVGALTEILADREGIGELSLLAPALRLLCEEDKGVALVAPPFPLYARAWEAKGIRLERMLIVETEDAELLWAAEQALRSGACGMVVAWARRAQKAFDYRALQRLHLAAGKGNAACVLYRPSHRASSASPAPLRMTLAPQDGQLTVNIVKRRSVLLAAPVTVDLCPPHWREAAAGIIALQAARLPALQPVR